MLSMVVEGSSIYYLHIHVRLSLVEGHFFISYAWVFFYIHINLYLHVK